MNNPHERDETIFEAALQLPPEERTAYLDQACAGDVELRQRVEALLLAHEQAAHFMTEPVPPPPGATIQISPESLPVSEKPGDRIGHYKLLQQIGEGGCGVVYMAEQTEPIRRRVAFKVIKLGMDTKQVIARFEAERQALALMDHPNIAKVLDAGAADTGRPYFVMELVKGIKITDFCDQNKLSTKERLDLFIQVCHAIQHAHQKGIIHRDIKPSNVLVTLHDGVPVPKVIDFGIAKATQQPLTDKTVFTAFGQFIGTPAYMSPEQAELSGLDIDTRTDIYSLGVLLYELLTGKPPFDPETLLKAGLDEMRRIIRETEPPKPSTKLTESKAESGKQKAETDRASARRLLQEVRGDLDWIVMKCLEKDRTRRYGTANDLASDLDRHMNNEPVMAVAPSAGYLLSRFLRRHRAPVAVAATVTVLLIAGVMVSTWQAMRANRAERLATERAQAEAAAKQESDRLRTLAEAKAESEAKAREVAQKAQAAEAEQRMKTADALAAEKEQRQKAEYEGYVAKIGLASAKVSNREFLAAQAALEACSPNLRHWEWGRLKYLCQLDLRTFKSKVRTVVISPNGKWVVSDAPWFGAGRDTGQVIIWDAETGEELFSQEVSLRPSIYNGVAFSPKGDLVLVPEQLSRRAVILDLPGRKERARLETGFVGTMHSAAFSPDGKRVVLGCDDPRARIHDTESGKELFKLPTVGSDKPDNVGRQVWQVAFSPDGKRVVTGGEFATQMWDAETGKELFGFRQGRGDLSVVTVFSPDGRCFLDSRGKRTALLRDSETGRELAVLDNLPASISAGCFSADGTRLATAHRDNAARIWEVASGKLVQTFSGHAAPVASVCFSADTRRILTASEDWTAKLWESDTGRLLLTFAGHSAPLSSAAFCPNPTHVLTCSKDGSAKLWTTETSRDRTRLTSATVSDRVVYLAAWSPDGQRILTASDRRNGQIDTPVSVWDAASGKETHVFGPLRGFASSVRFSPDSRRCFVGGGNFRVPSNAPTERPDINFRIWDVETGNEITNWSATATNWLVIAVSPDGTRGATGTRAGLTTWEVKSGKRLATLKASQNYLAEVVFSSDNKKVLGLYGSWGGGSLVPEPGEGEQFPLAKVWNVETGEELAVLKAYRNSILFASFLPDNRRVLIVKSWRTGILWDTVAGQRLAQFELEHGVFFPDYSRFTGHDRDGVANVYNLDTGAIVCKLTGHQQACLPTSVSPDGKRILTSSKDGTARLWDADTGREVMSLKGTLGKHCLPLFSPEGQRVLVIEDDQACILPAADWR